MKNPPAIRLLASDNNERGDLFTRLTKDLFFALGYENLRFDVHKTGREIDIQGEHRSEPRRVLAECKAHAKKMGGADLNKFRGVLGVERERNKPTPVGGYFVSLNGFRGTAIEQETEAGDQRVCLIDGKQVVSELQKSRVLVEHTVATEQAGRCAEQNGLKDQVIDGAELLGHKRGYIWAIYYSHGKERTHFALIHADGTPLAVSVAQEITDADKECGGTLHVLTHLAPPAPTPDRATLKATALARYREWLANECGYIQLDGLPTDSDLAATKLKLERLFVPLKATFLSDSDDAKEGLRDASEVHSIGNILAEHQHLALLATPGGGKSTLLKRLAVAYGCPDRLTEVDDSLPNRDWLPIFIRCRELRDRASRPIIELFGDLPKHAGMNGDETTAFIEALHESLRDGRALLLVDGLDEISHEGDRQTFAQHLRTFVGMFPLASLVVTSREAGFRHVAGVVASTCTSAKLAPFDEGDVLRLCVEWHVQVVGDNADVRKQAADLAKTIWDNERIRALAENPLLLTTLLVLKRTIRELPRSRAELYREAARVLVRTWNVEGFEPLDEDEALTQLSYVACSMMSEGIQQIGHRALLKLLTDARKELEAELQFAQLSPPEFIKRIELRSSLLMQTGQKRIDGKLQPLYEFRHLTFQEYLAARGYVEEQYPGRDDGKELAELLEPHFDDETWREVIPLAAVLAGRKAEETIRRLTTALEGVTVHEPKARCSDLLGQCLLDEVQIGPSTLQRALAQVARGPNRELDIGSVYNLLRGRFGKLLREIVEEVYLQEGEHWDEYYDALSAITISSYFGDQRPSMSQETVESLVGDLNEGDRIEKIRASLVCMWLAFEVRGESPLVQPSPLASQWTLLCTALTDLLDVADEPTVLAACWAFVWIGSARLWRTSPKPGVLLSFFRIWREAKARETARFASWALSKQPTLPRETFEANAWGDCGEFLQTVLDEKDRTQSYGVGPALLVAYYRRAPWTDAELAKLLSKHSGSTLSRLTAREMLAELGEPGRRVVETWNKEDAKRKEMRRDKKKKAKKKKRVKMKKE